MNGQRRLGLLAVPVCLLPLAILGIALAAGGTSQNPSANTGTCTGPSVPPGSSGSKAVTAASVQVSGLSATQTANARTIYDVSVSEGLPSQAAVIAIATAMQESRLLDLGFGDADSLGLFQQRPSQGWGSPAQIMQPVYAAREFYSALVAVPGWQSLPLTVAAQDVQHSAYPDAYTQWQPLAETLVSQDSGQASNCALDNGRGVAATGGSTSLPRNFSLPANTPSTVATAIAYAVAQLGKPYVWGGTGPRGFDCSGLIMMAYRAAGIQLPRTTFQQVNVGTPVYSLSQLQPGDLAFTSGSDGTPTNPGHVGIYIGDGLIIEAPQTGEPVQMEPVDNGYWNRETTAIRRVSPLRARI